jgi:dihydrofolate reductase
MTEFLARCDSIIFGRKSYEVLLQYEQNPYPDKQKYLFSNTITSAVGNTIVLKGNVQEALTLIQQRSSGDSWFFGGGSLLRDFMQHRLIDELHLSIHPVLLGGGTPLFSGLLERYWWQLSESKTYATGLVQLIYQRKI